MNTQKKVKNMVMAASIAAIIMIMAAVPILGYIPLGFMNATIVHIPVIIGAVLLGPKYGGFLGIVFAITSLMKNTFTPNPTSFVFSPFVSIGEFGGNGWSLVVCFVPRILIGVVAYYVYQLMVRVLKNRKGGGQMTSLWVAGIAGSITNTLLVMNFIYFFFGKSYAAASQKAVENIYSVILGIICINGIPEAILAGFLTAAITRTLMIVKK